MLQGNYFIVQTKRKLPAVCLFILLLANSPPQLCFKFVSSAALPQTEAREEETEPGKHCPASLVHLYRMPCCKDELLVRCNMHRPCKRECGGESL